MRSSVSIHSKPPKDPHRPYMRPANISPDTRNVISNPQLSYKKKLQIASTHQTQEPAAQEMPKAVLAERQKSIHDREMISAALSKHLIFTPILEEHFQMLIDTMKYYRIPPKEYVFRQDQPATHFFVLASGRLEVIVDTMVVNVLKPGQGFGELALIHDCARSASVRSLEASTFWAVDRSTFRGALTALNGEKLLENRSFIESVRLFADLTEVQKESLLTVAIPVSFSVGQKIVCEGDFGDIFFIIKEGVVACSRSNSEIRRLTKGDFFGEQALLYGGKRTATVTAVGGDVRCLAIKREDLVKVFGSQLQEVIYRNTARMACERSEVLRILRSEHVNKLIGALKVRNYEAGHIVIQPGVEKGVKLWIVLKGALKTTDTRVISPTLTCVGAAELMLEPRGRYEEAFYALGEEVVIAEIDRSQLEACIEGPLAQAARTDEAFGVLRRAQLFRGLSPSNLSAVVRAIQTIKYQDGQEIVREFNLGESLYIIVSGKVVIYQNGTELRTMSYQDFSGQRAVLFSDFNYVAVFAVGEAVCLTIKKVDLILLLSSTARQRVFNRLQLQDLTIDIDRLVIVKRIGKGRFSSVFLCVNLLTDAFYALKSVSRRHVSMYDIRENLVLQRKILLDLDHVFIVKLVRTFKDDKRLYLLMEYVNGLDFYDLLRKLGLFSDEAARFYTACLIVMLEYIHGKGVIYRDLKPENVLVDGEGFLRLIDFSTAKILHGRNYTVVGSPHYMAPEVITGKGYGYGADYYSMGVMLYEMLCGAVPFGDDEEDPYAIYQKVVEHRLEFSPYVSPDMPARPIIEQLLHLNPAIRSGGSIDNLKAHSWFSGFDWVFLI